MMVSERAQLVYNRSASGSSMSTSILVAITFGTTAATWEPSTADFLSARASNIYRRSFPDSVTSVEQYWLEERLGECNFKAA